MGLASSAEEPLPLRTVALKITEWVGRLGRVWVEGQVTQVSRRPGTTFLTLRDPVADVSMTVTAARQVVDGLDLRDGARVVCWVKPEVWMGRGALQLTAYEIRPVGTGALLARLEALKKVLAAEGLFAPEHKQPLPFLPRQVGLVTGRASAAERDVVENARRRWPAVSFVTREVAVQGPSSVTAVIEALSSLDRTATVDVIVLARGGGSVEDLLPWSDEGLCRAVFGCRTPVVSAIGHEQDAPLVDFVADVRCSTPTDAGKRVVPDVEEERQRVIRARAALARTLAARLDHERRALERMAAGPLVEALVARHDGALDTLRRRGLRALGSRLDRAGAEVDGLRSRVRTLSPLATLERGYALALGPAGAVLRSASDVQVDDPISVRLADGSLVATVTDVSVQSRS
ncbi:MAG TPA: exodeoxyribonuclease VII large subunit [Mycobacteriales bacterium]